MQKQADFCFDTQTKQDEEDLKSARSKIVPGSKSKLHIKVQELVKMIFDVDMMKKTMIEFEVITLL